MTWKAGRLANRSACAPLVSSKRSPNGPGASRHWPPRIASGSWRYCSVGWEAPRSCNGASHPTRGMSRPQPRSPPKKLATARRQPGRLPNRPGMAKSPPGRSPNRPGTKSPPPARRSSGSITAGPWTWPCRSGGMPTSVRPWPCSRALGKTSEGGSGATSIASAIPTCSRSMWTPSPRRSGQTDRASSPAAETARQRSGTPGAVPRSDVAHRDAAVLNGSDRILSHGAQPWRMTPNGCLGSPAIVSLRS
jgi:hypothetical protein